MKARKRKALNRFFLDKKTYHIYDNVIVPAGSKSFEIDHLVVSRYGVFLVTIKSTPGDIAGQVDDELWSLKHGKNSSSIANPLIEKRRRLQVLAEMVGVDPKKLFGVIAFDTKGTLAGNMGENVTRGTEYLKFIKKHQTALLGDNEVTELLGRIEQRCEVKARKRRRKKGHGADPTSSQVRLPTRLLVAFLGAMLGGVGIYLFLQSEYRQQVLGKLLGATRQGQEASDNNVGERPKEYIFSAEEVEKAIEEVLGTRDVKQNNDPGTGPPAEEVQYQYEIELHSGAIIYTDNLKVAEDTVSYTGARGLIISLDRQEISRVKKVLKE